MDIEEGEWIRTKDNGIDKFLYKSKYDNGVDKYVLKKTSMSNPEYYIVKHSKNIIDLIEVGDFVNGYKVISVDYNVIDNNADCIELDLNNNYQYNFISVNQIKTILTHEQYAQNAYRMEE